VKDWALAMRSSSSARVVRIGTILSPIDAQINARSRTPQDDAGVVRM
jgi:hypothetical protein